MTLLCVLMLLIMADMLFVALLASLFAKNLEFADNMSIFCSELKETYISI